MFPAVLFNNVVYCCVVLLIVMAFGAGAAQGDDVLTPEEAQFLERHWQDTIPLQGTPPAEFSPLESSLRPEDCGVCHVQQFQDWQTSLHARAMGPGVLGQLPEMVKHDPQSARTCWSCHTPLAEQQEVLFVDGQWRDNPAFDPDLQHAGLVCAACHVRQHQRYGPPRSATPEVTGKITGALPHGGFTAETAFTKSAFCANCHQFEPDGYALNGKLLENTYEEWRASRYAEEGVHCQDCHMPQRRHLWRGIQDADMVRSGIEVDVDVPDVTYAPGGELAAKIRITNSGVGHYFPTYVTPKVLVEAYLLDAAGEAIGATVQQAVIGREITLDLTEELYDTRIPPDETLTLDYVEAVPSGASGLQVDITVFPDHFYTGFFEAAVEGATGTSRQLLAQALAKTRNSPYIVYEHTAPLKVDGQAVGATPSTPARISSSGHDERPDWNEAVIPWLDYEEGLARAKAAGKPMMLVFYADWCPTCHAYRHIFRDAAVVDLADQFVMARVNVDAHPELSARFGPDGEYVPRVFVLNGSGEVMDALYLEREYPRFFFRADSPDLFADLMKRALSL